MCLDIKPVISAIEKTYAEIRIGIDASVHSISKKSTRQCVLIFPSACICFELTKNTISMTKKNGDDLTKKGKDSKQDGSKYEPWEKGKVNPPKTKTPSKKK